MKTTATFDQVSPLLSRWKKDSDKLRIGFSFGEVQKKAEGSPLVVFELKTSSSKVYFSSITDKAKTPPSVVFEMEGTVTGANDQLREVVFGCNGCSITLRLHDCTFEVFAPASILPEDERFAKATPCELLLKIRFPNGDTCLVVQLPKIVASLSFQVEPD